LKGQIAAIGAGKWKSEGRKWETQTPGKFPIDLGAGPLFSMTYEVFYFSGFPIDFGGNRARKDTIQEKSCCKRTPVNVPIRKS
jgi:hypothetical protein